MHFTHSGKSAPVSGHDPGGLGPSGLEKLASFLRDTPSSGRIRAARIIAVVADLVQIGFLPAFAEGFLSPVNDILDVAVAVTMVILVGWHWAFLPSIVSKLVPVWDLVPTWTAAVLFATRGGEPPKSEPPKTS
jgi:hypothetical protein